MMKKKLNKAQFGTSTFKTKEVTTSPNGQYKTKEIHKEGPKGMVHKSKTRRTVKGIMEGASKPNRSPMMPPPPTSAPLMTPQSKKPLMAKKGGAIKKKK
jgi:hypothetical protein